MVGEKTGLNAVILIDKPPGITSHDVIDRLRRLTGVRRIGHFGTLDPFATGLLVVGIGAGTKLSAFLTGDVKEYFATVRFGENRDTYDVDGKIIETFNTDGLNSERIKDALLKIERNSLQVPPPFSAVKLSGKPLYKYAREGKKIILPARKIRIDALDFLDFDGKKTLRIRVECSKGTYISSLAFDIGKQLGAGAFLFELRRVRSGTFMLKNAVSPEVLEEEGNVEKHLICLSDALPGWAAYFADVTAEKEIRNSGRLPMARLKPIDVKDSKYIKVVNKNDIVAIGVSEKKSSVDSKREEFIFRSSRVFTFSGKSSFLSAFPA